MNALQAAGCMMQRLICMLYVGTVSLFARLLAKLAALQTFLIINQCQWRLLAEACNSICCK